MRRQLPQKILFLNRDKGIRENRIPFSEFYSSISSAMTVRIAITTGIHFPRLISFPSYLAMKRDKRHWRAVPQSHSMCFLRHGGILVGSPNRHSRQVSVMRSSSRPLRAVRTVPEQAVETSQWRGWHEAASCDVRTHDAESVTSVCSEHHCRMACSGAYRIFLAEEDWCCLQDSQVSPLRSHFSWKIPSWSCSAPQLFPRFGWT